MQINKINNVSFKQTYDMHAHVGHWWCNSDSSVKDAVKTADGQYKVLKKLDCDVISLGNAARSSDDNFIKKAIYSNLDCMTRETPEIDKNVPFLKNEYEGNLEMLMTNIKRANYFYATGQPGVGNVETLRKAVEQVPEAFVGIKLHPTQLGIPADDAVFEPYMEFAREKKLPVLFHSQVAAEWKQDSKGNYFPELSKNLDNSDPKRIYNLAKKFPDVPVILGHTGAGAGEAGHSKALSVILESIKNNDAKLYCDISWMDFKDGLPVEEPKSLLNLIKSLKKENALDRIMFGSDAPVGIFGEQQASGFTNLSPGSIYDDMQNKIKNAIRKDSELSKDADEIIDMIFYKNADKLFFENFNPQKPISFKGNNLAEESSGVVKKMSKTKIGLIIGAIVGLGGLIGAYLYKNNNKTKETQKTK